MEALLQSIWGRHWGLEPAFRILIWGRVSRIRQRFASLVARIRAGVPARKSAPRPAASRPQASASEPRRRQRLPDSFAWLCRYLPQVAAGFGSQLQLLLQEAEMQALIAADPRVGRILRPLCRMLAVPDAPGVLPPRPPRPARLHPARPRGAPPTPPPATPPPPPSLPPPSAHLSILGLFSKA